MTQPMFVPQFQVRQKLTLMVNRYEIHTLNPDSTPGQLMAFAEQKRLAFKEQVTFFADQTKTRPVFGFKARQVMDLNAGYDVTDEQGAPIGYFQKDFKSSLLRSTFNLEGPGYAGRGQERSQLYAIIRRFTDFSFLPFHFDFADSQGQPLFSSERQVRFRDMYTVTVHDQRVDFRVAAAVAVGLDALMAR